ncbi:MAG: chorismate synthase, partial [Muribaculaceae bacterium]|nr:chorismate synthase [Muribaculaceae bacterium]
ITMRIAFKPVPTLMRDVPTVDCDGNAVTLHPRGRHDACVLPRAQPIVESMAALVMLDNYLIKKTNVL